MVIVTGCGITDVSCSRFHDPESGLKHIGINTLIGSGVVIFRGSMAASGMPIARNNASVRVTPIANMRSLTLGAQFVFLGGGRYGIAW